MKPIVEITPNQKDRLLLITIRKVNGENDTFQKSLFRFLTAVSNKIKLHPDCDPKIDEDLVLYQRVPDSKDFETVLGIIQKLVYRYSSNMAKEAETISKALHEDKFMAVHKLDNPFQLRVEGTPDILK